MSSEVSWHVELAIKPGKLADFIILSQQMIESSRTEPGVLIYERFIDDRGRTAFACERYVDSASAVNHLSWFSHAFASNFAALVERKRFLVFGLASDELKMVLDDYGASYFQTVEGHSVQDRSDEIR